MICDVEKLGTELQVSLFADARILHDREIEVTESRPDRDVAPSIAEGQRRIGRERSRVKPLRQATIQNLRTYVTSVF